MLVHYTTRFIHEADEQAEYLAQYSPVRAGLFIDSIFRQLDLLKAHPRLGRVVPEFTDEAIRELLFRQYRLIYRLISEDRIDVLTIQSGLRPLQGPL
ncbi:type II toxin-antitoxin system RelE/ParE family toxin [uncultured Hymenobacter sp.]|uniref:type II toxin-antitoxin system RelE/ParE family toxin n=1 Tax=uncultured Hymenobacter sp. TaxID=170016 RepID=UPI0035CC8E5C